MQDVLLLKVVVREGAPILELFAGKDQRLMVGRSPFLLLDLGFDIVDRVGRLDFQSDGLAGQRLDEDLHATPQTKDEMERRLLLDVVVREGATVLELLSCEDQTLLVGRDTIVEDQLSTTHNKGADGD